MSGEYKAEIVRVSRNRPDFVLYLFTSGPGSGGGENFLINLKCLEILMKHFGAKNHRELAGKTFEVDEVHNTDKVFRQFFRDFYPDEKGIKIAKHQSKSPKYDPMVWEIAKIWEPRRHFLFGPGEEDYYIVRLLWHKKGRSLPCGSAPAYLREKTLLLVMKHFGVKSPKKLIGKQFRANVGEDAQAAMLVLALKAEHPDLV